MVGEAGLSTAVEPEWSSLNFVTFVSVLGFKVLNPFKVLSKRP